MNKGLISKIIKICILVIIPLVAGVLIGVYAYDHYQLNYFDQYMEDASDENTEDRLVSYLNYITKTVEYTETEEGYDFYFKQDFSNEYGDLFTLAIIRSNEIINGTYTTATGQTSTKKRDNYYMTYYFAIYNVNYETLAKTLDPTEEHPLLVGELPLLSIEIVDKTDEDVKMEFDTTTVAQLTGESDLVVIYDYGFSPSLDSKGDKLNAGNPTSMRYYVLNAESLSDFSPSVTINVNVKSNWESEDDQAEPETVAEVSKDDFFSNKELQKNEGAKKEVKATFNKAYNRDIFAAGYNKYVFSHYIWWESLVAVVLFEIVCASFVLVWSSEEQKAKQAKQKK